MENFKRLIRFSFGATTTMLAAVLLAGCIADEHPAHYEMSSQPSAAAPAPAPAPVAAPAPKLTEPIRIKAGLGATLKDAEGNTWLPDQGFGGGETTERPDLQITNTRTPDLYRSEHYSMTNFVRMLPNGKYTAKLHFCETFEGITGPGQRVFSFNVMGHEFKDFDIWVKAPGFLHPYIETVPVNVTDGKFWITFTANIENPQICAIEIIPTP